MNNTTRVIFAAILIILGIVFIQVYADSEYAATNLAASGNETVNYTSMNNRNESGIISATTYTVTNAYTGTDAFKSDISGCAITATRYGNGTTSYVSSGNYSLSTTGVLTIQNTSATFYGGNVTILNYKYCPDGYVGSGWENTIMDLGVGFFALLIFAAAVALLYQVYRDVK